MAYQYSYPLRDDSNRLLMTFEFSATQVQNSTAIKNNQASIGWRVCDAIGGEWYVRLDGQQIISYATADTDGTFVNQTSPTQMVYYKSKKDFLAQHEIDGTKTLTIELCGGGSPSTIPTFTKTFTVELDRIEDTGADFQLYDASFPAFNDAQGATFTYHSYGYENVEYITLNDSGNIFQGKEVPVPTSKEDVTITLELTDEEKQRFYKYVMENAEDLTNPSAYCDFYFKVKFKGIDTVYTNTSRRVLISITDSAPTLAPNIVDTNAATIALTGNAFILVLNASNAQVTPNAQATKGGTLTKFGFENSGIFYDNYETLNLPRVESNIFSFYATDNRGQTTRQVVTTPHVPYVMLSSRVVSGAPSGEGEMNVVVRGSYYNGSFGLVDNELFVYFRYKTQNDEQFGDWIRFTDVTINKDTHTYEARAYLSGLNYQDTYIFQSQAADALYTINSKEKVVATTPIFDWSDKDFNFNVPVYIQGHLIGGANAVLWSGRSSLMANANLQLSQPISEQMHGVVLVFSGASSDASWSTHFIPKVMVEYYNGGGHTCMMGINAGLSVFGAKYVYIEDEVITGHASNDSKGEAASGITFDNSAFALRYVIGV